MAQNILDFQDLLEHVLGLSAPQRNAVTQEGYDSLDTVAQWSHRDIKEFVKIKASARVQAERVSFGAVKVKNIMALAFWSKDQRLRGHQVDVQDFDLLTQSAYREMCEIEHTYSESAREMVDLPPPIKDETDFTKWDKTLTNALRSRRSIEGGPLSYIIRRDTDRVLTGLDNLPDRVSELEINMPHSGPAFGLDNRNTFNLIFALIDGTSAEAWIQRRTISSRSAVNLIKELRSHYDGTDHKEMVLKKAEMVLSDTFYRCQEATFSWESYTTKLKDAYEQIAYYDEQVSDRMQVEQLIRHIVVPANAPIGFTMALQHVRNYKSTTYSTLNAAAAYLKAQIVDLFPTAEFTARKRTVNSAEAQQVVKKQGKDYVAGVDITDRNRRFTPEEWKKLQDAGYVPTLLADKRRNRQKKRVSGVETDRTDDAGDGNQVPEMITLTREQVAEIAASYTASSRNPPAQASHGTPRAGAQVGATMTDSGSVTSGITNDGTTWSVPLGRRRTSAVRIQARHLRSIHSLDTSIYQSSRVTTPLPTESDNHADTHCFGANFRPINWANYTCTVTPFLEELNSADEIPVCQAATAWDSPEGITFILVFGQGLYFGERMRAYSLINPNQCRAYGVQLCDDPTDPHRQLGIYDPVSEISVPMQMNGSFASLLTRLPSEVELLEAQSSNRMIYLSDPDSWNPHTFQFRTSISAVAIDHDILPRISVLTGPEQVLGQVSNTLVPSEFARAVASSACSMSPAISSA